MTVRSEGDTWVMEQLGEKQDFEAELSRLGFRHEDFSLCVRRARPARDAWSSHYAVRVTNCQSGKSNIYWGGLDENWVSQFTRDLADGFFGHTPARHTITDTPRPWVNR